MLHPKLCGTQIYPVWLCDFCVGEASGLNNEWTKCWSSPKQTSFIKCQWDQTAPLPGEEGILLTLNSPYSYCKTLINMLSGRWQFFNEKVNQLENKLPDVGALKMKHEKDLLSFFSSFFFTSGDNCVMFTLQLVIQSQHSAIVVHWCSARLWHPAALVLELNLCLAHLTSANYGEVGKCAVVW